MTQNREEWGKGNDYSKSKDVFLVLIFKGNLWTRKELYQTTLDFKY